jgi:hypothetical protein
MPNKYGQPHKVHVIDADDKGILNVISVAEDERESDDVHVKEEKRLAEGQKKAGQWMKTMYSDRRITAVMVE